MTDSTADVDTEIQAATSTNGRRGLTLATLCLAVLIAQLDSSVVNLAIRPIGQYFHARVGALQWIVDGYNLIYAVFLLTGGLLADLYGRRRVFMAGAAVFVLASILSAQAATIVPAEIGLALTGLGMGLATGPLMGVAVDAVSAARSGSAASLINVARMIGATLGVAALGRSSPWSKVGPGACAWPCSLVEVFRSQRPAWRGGATAQDTRRRRDRRLN